MIIVFAFIGIFLVDNIARAEVLTGNTTYTIGCASNLLRNQSFKLSANATIKSFDLYLKNNLITPFTQYVCLTSSLNTVNNSSGCLTASAYVSSSATSLTWINFNIGDYDATASTTYYLKLYQPSTNMVWGCSSNFDYYQDGCYYSSGTACYAAKYFYDTNFKVNGDFAITSFCGDGVVDQGEWCDDGRDPDLIFYAGCNTTCNGYIINIMDIGILSYYATSTAITASTTIEVGQLISPILLYFFVFSIFAVGMFLIRLFFYSK